MNNSSALIVIDVQNCFVSGGTLPVPEGETIIPLVNEVAKSFENVILTQDWHTPNHISFASSHPGKNPFEVITVDYGVQVLWPDHCIQGTYDAELVRTLDIKHASAIIRKGFHQNVDSYSAFVEADGKTHSGLVGYLRQREIDTLFFVGLATDFCVAWSALDARKFGFQTYVIEDACRAIDLNGSLQKAWNDMLAAGVKRINSNRLIA